MILIVLGHCSLTMSFESVLPAISEEKLGVDSEGGTQLLIMGVGIGAMFTAIWLAGVRSEKTRGWLFLIFGISSGIGPIILALSTDVWISLLATVIMGMNQGGFMTITHTIIQSIVDDSVRGRVSGVYSFHVGGSMALANGVNAGLVDVSFLNAPLILAVGGVIFVGAMFVSLANRSLRGIYFGSPAVPAAA